MTDSEALLKYRHKFLCNPETSGATDSDVKAWSNFFKYVQARVTDEDWANHVNGFNYRCNVELAKFNGYDVHGSSYLLFETPEDALAFKLTFIS